MTNTPKAQPFSAEDFKGLAETNPDPWGWTAADAEEEYAAEAK